MMFKLEGAINEGARVDSIDIPCYGSHSHRLIDDLEEACKFLFDRDIKVSLTENDQERLFEDDESHASHLSEGYTCLFSIGLDSYSGILNARKHLANVCGAFVSHADQKNLLPLLDKFQLGPFNESGLHVRVIDADSHGDGMRRFRGIFYILNGLTLGNRNIIVCEVGPTMYQVPFTVLDDITVTAHPKALEFAHKIAYDVLGTEIRILTPNEDLTKAEVAATCRLDRFVKKTVSCSRTSFANSEAPNCGTCYPCIVRRLGVLVAGAQDSRYRYNFAGNIKHMGAYDNIVQLIRFSIDFLKYPEHVPWYTLNIPRTYGKLELFRRFALDNLAGLKVLAEQTYMSVPLTKLHTLASDVISKECLEDRIASVRGNEFKPNLGNWK